jgi:hypothetical protein
MEQLDPEDGLAVWDLTEDSQLPGENLAVRFGRIRYPQRSAPRSKQPK